MPGNRFGQAFSVTTFGESHGGALGAVIDGVPPGLALDLQAIQAGLDRRRPGQGRLVSPRREADGFEIVSGLFEGRTTGTPLTFLFRNTDARPADYAAMRDLYRPSHADFTYDAKYGLRDWRGGGRASARETVARVAAGEVARQWLAALGVDALAWVESVADITAPDLDPTREEVEASEVRCPDPVRSAEMAACILEARREGDSVGGVIRARCTGVPAGWGEPVFDKLEAELARAMLSLPAARGFEIGSGYAGARMRGSAHNDLFEPIPGADPALPVAARVRTATNRSGGVQGGISNGMPIRFSVAFKPVATILRPQPTVDREGRPAVLQPRGRHDPCVLPRAVPLVEAMALLVLADHALRAR